MQKENQDHEIDEMINIHLKGMISTIALKHAEKGYDCFEMCERVLNVLGDNDYKCNFLHLCEKNLKLNNIDMSRLLDTQTNEFKLRYELYYI